MSALMVAGIHLLWTGPALAEEPAAPGVRDDSRGRAVSTSPIPPKSSPIRVVPGPTMPPRPSVPLTRAAAREQLEGISPVGWLGRFGSVDIQPRD